MAARFCRTRDRAVTDDGQPRSAHHVDEVRACPHRSQRLRPSECSQLGIFLCSFGEEWHEADVANARHIGGRVRSVVTSGKKGEKNQAGSIRSGVRPGGGGEKACEPTRTMSTSA